jgi:hypothetical protein
MGWLLVRLWQDDGGAILASEWLLVATLLVLGSLTCLVTVRQAVLAELEETGNALLSLDQSYSYSGQTAVCPPLPNRTFLSPRATALEAATAGSASRDTSSSLSIGSVPPDQINLHDANPCD